MNITLIIPARMASTRLPGKPLVDICGKPMVIRVWERLKRAGWASDVVIATDDERIGEAAKRHGAPCVMTSKDCRTGTDRVAEAAANFRSDVFVNVQGDEPLIELKTVKAAVDALENVKGASIGTVRCPILSEAEFNDPSAVKVLVAEDGRALYFSRRPVPYDVQGALKFPSGRKDPFGRHVGIYAFRKAFLKRFPSLGETRLERLESLEQLRAMEHGYVIGVGFAAGAARGVDTPVDLERVRSIYKSINPVGNAK